MADDKAKKDKPKPKDKPQAGGAPKAEKKPKAPKPEKAEAVEKVEAPKPERKPADPRQKLLKKFHGKLLPRGPLRDRHKAILDRWNSGEEHGGVTAEELKSLLDEWRASRAKPVKAAK